MVNENQAIVFLYKTNTTFTTVPTYFRLKYFQGFSPTLLRTETIELEENVYKDSHHAGGWGFKQSIKNAKIELSNKLFKLRFENNFTEPTYGFVKSGYVIPGRVKEMADALLTIRITVPLVTTIYKYTLGEVRSQLQEMKITPVEPESVTIDYWEEYEGAAKQLDDQFKNMKRGNLKGIKFAGFLLTFCDTYLKKTDSQTPLLTPDVSLTLRL